MATLNDVTGIAGNVLGEVNEKVEWGVGFVTKYAKPILAIVGIYALAKIFKVKIQI